MKLLFFIYGFEQGGVATAFNALARELESCGHVVKAILPYERQGVDVAIERKYFLAYTPEKRCKVPKIGRLWILCNCLLNWHPYFGRLKVSFEYDKFVFYHGQETFWRWYRPVPAIFWFHEIASDNTCLFRPTRMSLCDRLIRWSKRRASLGYTQYVAVTKNSARSLQAYYGLKKLPIVINNLIDVDGIRKRSEEEQCEISNVDIPQIGYVGRLSVEKGVDRLLAATDTLNSLGFKFSLWIIGEGPEKDNLASYVSGHKLENVRFLGRKDNPYPYMRACDLMVLPSKEEGMGLVLWESLLCGTPVLATNSGGANDALMSGRWGRLVDNSLQGVLSGLRQFLESPKSVIPKIGLEQIAAEIELTDAENRRNIRSLFSDGLERTK